MSNDRGKDSHGAQEPHSRAQDKGVDSSAGRNAVPDGICGWAKPGEPELRRDIDDPTLTAETLMLFRLLLGDEELGETEIATFRRICWKQFGIDRKAFDALRAEMEIVSEEGAWLRTMMVFRSYGRDHRIELAERIDVIMRSDLELSAFATRLLDRTLELLDLDQQDIQGAA